MNSDIHIEVGDVDITFTPTDVILEGPGGYVKFTSPEWVELGRKIKAAQRRRMVEINDDFNEKRGYEL